MTPPIAHMGHWAWLEPLLFAPALGLLALVWARDRRARRRDRPAADRRTGEGSHALASTHGRDHVHRTQ